MSNPCMVCGKPRRPHCRTPWHTACEPDKRYDATGRCLVCGVVVPAGHPRSGHLTKHRVWTPWAKGKTKQDDPRLEKIAAAMSRRQRKTPMRVKRARAAVMHTEEAKRKSKESQIRQYANGMRLAFGGKKRGMGTPTESEAFLRDIFSKNGFVYSFVVTTKLGKGHHYVVDFAHPGRKLAVEIDGNCYDTAEAKMRDATKDLFLRGKGWRVKRFRATKRLCVLRAQVERWLLHVFKVSA